MADPRVPMTVPLMGRPVTRAEREGWAYDVKTMERFDVTAASVWHQTGADSPGQSMSAFPPLRMPYPDLWVEAASHLIPERSRFGALVKDRSNEDVEELFREIRDEDPTFGAGDRALLLRIVTWSGGHLNGAGAGLRMSPLFHVFHVTTAGVYVDYRVHTGGLEKQPGKTIEAVEYEASVERVFLVQPLLFGLSLSNVRGSRTSQPRLLGNPHNKKGKRRSPRNRYRVITIPGSPTDERRNTGGHRDVAKHLVRGHFKRYGPDNKLFGKYETTVWVPHHVRGKREQGVVEKDYSVEPPTD